MDVCTINWNKFLVLFESGGECQCIEDQDDAVLSPGPYYHVPPGYPASPSQPHPAIHTFMSANFPTWPPYRSMRCLSLPETLC